MPTRFCPAGVARLRQAAKALRRDDPSLSQSQALDQVAVLHGWPNWALLQRNALAPVPSSSLRYDIQPLAAAAAGVRQLKLEISDPDARALARRVGCIWFALPALPPGWFLGPVQTPSERAPDPAVDPSWPPARGLLVEGRFACVVTVDAAAPGDQADALKQFASKVRALAAEALDAAADPSSPAAGAMLFSTKQGPDGTATVWEMRCDSLTQAMAVQFEAGHVPSAILAPDGWWSFSTRVGWRPVPAKA